MSDRFFLLSHRVRLFLVSLGVVALAAPGAMAALKKYDIRRSELQHYQATSPHARYVSAATGGSKAVIDESGANPVMKKLIWVTGAGGGSTILTPSLSGGFIWINTDARTSPADGQSGTGSTASSITWGDLDGWTITGGTWCHAVPSYICSFALVQHDATVDATLISTHWDIGTWVFHGTGFTDPVGYVVRTANTQLGNFQRYTRGAIAQDGTVPALPLLGIGAVGVSVLAMGISAVRKRRE